MFKTIIKAEDARKAMTKAETKKEKKNDLQHRTYAQKLVKRFVAKAAKKGYKQVTVKSNNKYNKEKLATYLNNRLGYEVKGLNTNKNTFVICW